MVTSALKPFQGNQNIRFVSNVDPADLNDNLLDCDPKSTFFLLTSKTFTTAETLQNASLARSWLKQANVTPFNQMAAITAAPQKAIDWGISKEKIFDFADGIGGRYSLWSSVGLPIMIAIGNKNFRSFLEGAAEIDKHVFNTPIRNNICLLYTSPSPRDRQKSRMPSSA